MRILYFAQLRDATGCSEEDLPVQESLSTPELWDKLIERHPALAKYRSNVRMACNQEYLTASETITDQDEVALIPPVSGG